MKRLDTETCESLFKEFDTPPQVIAHCRAVSSVAFTLATRLSEAGRKIDPELACMAGLIHDVMRRQENHGVVAADMLAARGYVREAAIVRVHMFYSFNDPVYLNETDLVCLADRLVKEDRYVGIDRRIEYLIHKAGDRPERTKQLLASKHETQIFMRAIEKEIGQSIDSLFLAPEEIGNIMPRLENLLKRVQKPARYIGREFNICQKDPTGKLRFAFCFPDLYEIGMSYMGLQILYAIVNQKEDLYLERVFAPAPDMAALMRDTELPLFTLETKTPLARMDAVGFTIQYEMCFTTILDILELAGITALRSERAEEEPLLLAGGPCAFNPEPLADFFDIFLIGDGEELLPAFLTAYHKSRDQGISKEDFLLSVASWEGVYVPGFYEAHYFQDGTVEAYKPLKEGIPARARRAFLSAVEEVPFPEKPLVPLIETVHDRAVVETFRGCTRGCRFCQAGMIYRPVRERRPETIKKIALAELANTGHEELSLLSLSTSDYSSFESLATDLMETCAAKNVALSLPSLRLDSFSFRVLQENQKYRKSGLTFAPEAGTQRLRDVINKNITEEDIHSAITQAITLGWQHIKLYFMIGLPTETEEDLDGIAKIARDILQMSREAGCGRRFQVTVSVSNFVPKAHTPFQWAAMDDVETLRRKHDYLKKALHIKGVRFHYHDDFTSELEGLFARGDRRLGKLLIAAHQAGCRLDSWSEYFDAAKWRDVIKKTGTDLAFYTTRERGANEVLPWDIIDSGVEKRYLEREYQNAHAARTTRDCRYGCTGCGVNRRIKCPLDGIYKKKGTL